MASHRNNFAYLLRMISEDQRKTISDWNALIRAALMEVDNDLGKTTISERNVVFTFPEYVSRLQNLGAERGFEMETIAARTQAAGAPQTKKKE